MTEQETPLSEEQIEHFYREGYVVVPGLVPQSEIEAVLNAAPPQEATGGWRATIFRHAEPLRDAAIHRLLVEAHVVGAVRQIFANEPRVLYGMLAVVPARGGTGLPWHQDNQYTQMIGSALNTFVALSEITPDKAILWVSPQSHRLGVQPSRSSDLYGGSHREAAVEPTNGIPLPTMRPGDACLFDRSTYHRSLKNETDEPRFAYAAQYQAENARVAETGKIDTPDISPRMRVRELAAQWKQSGLLK